MRQVFGGFTVLTTLSLAIAVALCPAAPGQIVYPTVVEPANRDLALADSAVGAVIEANRGKPPATGEQLWQSLAKLGKFAQLPMPFSAVHLQSGLGQPRVIITPLIDGLGKADVTARNLNGRLFLAANMERGSNGDPRVTSVEFISWNTARRKFDFGVIENMGGDGEPELRVLDGGKCFSCHKNRGPILGVAPWSNSTHDDILRLAAATGLRLTGSSLPTSGPFALPEPVGKFARTRIDGMALATPEARSVDFGVRHGADLRLNRDTFQLMTRAPDGRKAFVAMLLAIVGPGPLDPNDRSLKALLDDTFDKSFRQFAGDWVNLQKEAKSSVLIDADPADLLVASGVRPNYSLALLAANAVRPVTTVVTVPVARAVRVPGLSGGAGSRWAAANTGITRGSATTTRQTQSLVSPAAAMAMIAASKAAAAKQANDDLQATLAELANYENARSRGSHGLTTPVQPSNPRAFLKPPVKTPVRPSDVVNAVMLAGTIGLTEGDRKFLAAALADAAKRVKKQGVTATTLARAVFEGPEFTDFLAGGPLPDRDEFKDRFVAGVDAILKSKHGLPAGLFVSRKEYASGPKYDPKAVEESEVAVVPTTACLRCHDVRGPGKAPRFDPIPALAFDPFDKPGRAAWLRTAPEKRKVEVLSRMQERLFTDTDMPPEDTPEYDRFRVQEAAAFDEVKGFLKAELDKAKGK